MTREQTAELSGDTRYSIDRWLLPGDNDRWLPVPQLQLDLLCRRLGCTYEKAILKCRNQ